MFEDSLYPNPIRSHTVQLSENPKDVLDILIIRNQQRELQGYQTTINPLYETYTSISLFIISSGLCPKRTFSSSKKIFNIVDSNDEYEVSDTISTGYFTDLIELVGNE